MLRLNGDECVGNLLQMLLVVAGHLVELFLQCPQPRLAVHKFKRSGVLPRVRRVLGVLQGVAPVDLLDIGIEKQEDIREGVKAMQSRIKEILPYLQELAEKGPERETYKDNLDDAIEATQDAEKDLEKAAQELAPPPVRRKPS